MMSGEQITAMAIEVRPLTKELREAYLSFFDHMVFEENPDRAKCYCYDYHFTGDVESCTREMSRAAVKELIGEGGLTGYLAFSGDVPVGWCNANDRSNYQRLLKDYDYVDDPEARVCSIVCFLIHPDHRRQGIAQQLLEQVIEDRSTGGYDYLEAYPRKGNASEEGGFKGPLALYQRHGFKVHKENDDHYVVRRAMP